MASPGKILILVENLPVPFDRRVWMEATTLAEAGYKVSVICPQGQYPKHYEVLNGISIYRYPLPSLQGILGHLAEYGLTLPITFFLTWIVFFREGFDVIHSANPPDLFFLVGGFFKLFGKRFVFDHHDLVPESCLARWSGLRQRMMYNVALWAEKATFRVADIVISTNQSYKDVAIARGRVAPERVFVVRSGPCKERFQLVAARFELKKGRRYLVCYLGVMGPHDGLDLLLKAVSYTVHDLKRADIQFTLIGDGDIRPALVDMAKELRIRDAICFTGRIPDQQVIEYLSTADVCVAPDPKDSLNDLSTMNKIVEYLALGKPVVAFDLHEARVSAGDAALYAKPNDYRDFADKIVALLEQPDRRQRMGDLGRLRFLNTLAWEHQRQVLLEAYSAVLNNRPSQ